LSHAKVLAVDAEADDRGLTRLLGVASGPGLLDVADRRTSLQQAMLVEPGTGLSVLSAGAPLKAGGDRASAAESIRTVLENAAFDTVIVDGSSDSSTPLARELAEVADQVVLVVTAGQTRGRHIDEFLRASSLRAAKTRGIVLVTKGGIT